MPRDVSIVAICPDDVAERARPELTSVDVPAGEVGRRAVELVMAKLDGRQVPAATLVPPHLRVRASTVRADTVDSHT